MKRKNRGRSRTNATIATVGLLVGESHDLAAVTLTYVHLRPCGGHTWLWSALYESPTSRWLSILLENYSSLGPPSYPSTTYLPSPCCQSLKRWLYHIVQFRRCRCINTRPILFNSGWRTLYSFALHPSDPRTADLHHNSTPFHRHGSDGFVFQNEYFAQSASDTFPSCPCYTIPLIGYRYVFHSREEVFYRSRKVPMEPWYHSPRTITP